MSLRNASALTYSPIGVSDALDTTNAFEGAMSALTNLVPDPTTRNIFVPRPASVEKTSFSSFSTPGFVSCEFIVGDIAYGMIASASHAGKDEPFAYDIINNAFIAITGVTNANSPASPSSSSVVAWEPPKMDLISTKIIVAHSGFPGAATGHYFGVLDITIPAAPTWDSINTTTNALPSVPTWVSNFNNRAYFTCGNLLYFSDVLVPTTITNASQFLTLGDTTAIVATQPLPFDSTAGGTVQGLIAFKNKIIYQITGDLALSNLLLSVIPSGVGTYAPLSICGTPNGIGFIANDGLRFISFVGNISEPVGYAGTGVSVPFIDAATPSRIAAAYNQNTIIISVSGVEYWYNIARKIWTGPHTFPASLIQPYKNTFIKCPVSVTASLWQSDPYPNSLSVYTENSTALTISATTPLLPDNKRMAMNSMIETTIEIAFENNTGNITVTMTDENASVIGQGFLAATGTTTVWGSFIWGAAKWLGNTFSLQQKQVLWSAPVVFKQAMINVIGPSVAGMKLSNFNLKYQVLGYLIQ